MIDQCRHCPWEFALLSRPRQSFWHFSSDRVQTQSRLWLRLIRSTVEIMTDYTLVCVSTNRTIVFSQAAVLTGGFTEAKGSGISLSGEPKCWVEQSCPSLQKPPEYRSKQHCLQSERVITAQRWVAVCKDSMQPVILALMFFSRVWFIFRDVCKGKYRDYNHAHT